MTPPVESYGPGPRGHRRPAAPSAAPAPGARAQGDLLALLACLVLMGAAALPLSTVFLGQGWVRPVAGAVLVSVGLSWGARQLGLPAVAAAALAAAGWVVFTGVVYAPETMAASVLPTADTLGALRALAAEAAEELAMQTSPTPPIAPLSLLAVSGAWLVGSLAAQALLRPGGSLRGIALALVMFAFPLPMAPNGTRATGAAVAFLAAAALTLLVTGRGEAGSRTDPAPPDPLVARRLLTAGAVAGIAIIAGVALGDALPGAGEPPVYQVRGRGGTTVTTNPMVNLRPNLTAEDRGPVLRVNSERPVYLRTTALDTYDEFERWTTSRIRSTAIDGGQVPSEVDGPVAREEITVDVEVANLSGVLVPVPYPPTELSGETAESFQYDSSNGTVTVATGSEIDSGDTYTVSAALPPDPERLEDVAGFAPDSSLTALPGNVPEDVVDLARSIVEDADASTPLRQAIAIQEELRTWTYSLEPEEGHGGDAMQAFVEHRVGYCEQFAGTMAVMLRTLDIPARVAVGFSPGERVGSEDLWSVSNANAHAWVEVLFPGHGWVAFEPTPRGDGNVLVPSAATLAPTSLAAEDRVADDGAPDASPTEDVIPGPNPADPAATPDTAEPPEPPGASAGASAGTDDSGLGWWATGILLAGVALAGVGVVLATSRSPRRHGPRQRVLRATRRAERLGRGLGVHPRASDTDAEYLSRVGARVDHADAARTLAVASARARYDVAVDEADAQRAERAAASLLAAVRGAVTRAAATLRGAVSQGLRALPGRRR